MGTAVKGYGPRMSSKQTAEQAFSHVEEDLRSISKWMYDHPELGYKEFESSRRLGEFLGDNGFDVTFPAHGLETSFEANVGKSGPRVVICCEYDALPEVGHACGHNIIATSALGAGIALAEMTDDMGIRLTILGTPAEEGGGGKVELINAGCCGMAGSFGFEREHYQVSMTIGEHALFPAVNAKGPDWEIAVMGVSCRQQIEDGTGRRARHLVEVLRDSLP